MSAKSISTAAIVVLVIAAAVAGSLATRYFSAYERKSDIAQMDEAVRKEMQTAQFAKALSTHFPAEYKEFLSDILAAGSNGTEQDVKLASYQFMKRFMRTQMPNIVLAQDAAIQKIIDEQVDVIALFKGQSVKLCADFGMRGLGPDSNVDDAAIKELGDVVTSQILAAHDGTQSPVTRTPPGAEEWKKLIAVMQARGASEPLLSKIFIVGDLSGLTVEEECDFSYILLTAMGDLETETRIRLFTLFLKESAKL